MAKGDRYPRKGIGLTRLAVQALALVLIIPSLAIAYIFRDNLKDQALPLIFLILVAFMGFFLFWRVFSAIGVILKKLEKVSRGEATAVDLAEGPVQLREMTEIINALNKLTIEFRENAAQLETFIEQFTTLTELTEITARIPDINELLSLVLNKAMSSIHARMGTVMLEREDGAGLEIVAAEGWTPSNLGPINPKETLSGKVIDEGVALLVENIDSQPELGRRNDSGRYSSPSFLIVPLVTKSDTIGAVCLSEKGTGKAFTSQDQKFLAVILGQVGFAVENARLLKRARESAVELQRAINYKDIQLQDAHRKIIQAEKLSALGQVIAGVAHEINNPLTSVTGYAELLLLKHDSQILQTESLRENLRTIHEEAIRATRIVQNLLSFAREKKPEMQMADANEVVRKVLHLRQYDLETHGIQVTVDLDPNLPGTMLDVDQIQQVVLNLVNNSAQALTENGPRHVQVGTRSEHGEILLWVSDTGQGIPAAVVDRIFDPFFTTKSGKVNSGLGLSISYGIIREHGGTIEVDSTEGQGTRMTLHLPVVSAGTKEPSAGEDERDSYRPKGGLLALVVDDEASIANLMAEMLTTAGFQVETSSLGMEALEKIGETDYDLVISDLRMPDLGGVDLFEKIQSSKPHMASRFVLTSGDVADQHAREFADKHNLRLIAKPFSRRDLLRAAKEALSR